MDFQEVITRLNQFWADHGCLLWQPHNVQVGAGTMNPATVLRVLGPEPWNVAYVEPSVRPADGRYGENPNRWQQYFQYQVILKPEPGNPQELYLDSLRALGIDTRVHDVRFVEDNWESPALGAWGLGWEVWLNGQEITQYTYFQQAGGVNTEPVSVEITYGLERIVMALQGVRTFQEMRWHGELTYGELLLRGEVEGCTYNFQVAGVENLRQMYDLCEAEAKNALARGLALPAHDYVLKCSHIFNVLDARGAIGVTERARSFMRMRDLARQVTDLFLKQREEAGYPFLLRLPAKPVTAAQPLEAAQQPMGPGPFEFLLEIGCEELPVGDLDDGLAQLRDQLAAALANARLPYVSLDVEGTPRRMVVLVHGLAAAQSDRERVAKGPAVRIAYDEGGEPTKAALGFARAQGVDVSSLQRRLIDGREYVVSVAAERGRQACAVLAEILPGVLGALRFAKSMRWNASGISYSRPVRWCVALLEDQVIPLEFAGIRSGRLSRGIRPLGCPELVISRATAHAAAISDGGIICSRRERQRAIVEAARALAAEVGGVVPEDAELLAEVANLVEYPLCIRGSFAESYLRLPDDVLLAVMRKHQRYLPILRQGRLLPHFVAVANGSSLDVAAVRHGNEEVLRARYADAAFFHDADCRRGLAEFTPRLGTLTFQEQLGSVLDKVHRIERLTAELSQRLGLSLAEAAEACRAAALCKSDLATQLVVELTSLQGKMGRHYAELAGEPIGVARAIEEHYLPRFVGDRLPASRAAMVVGLADRLDTLVGLFSVGVRPSGAADPWGLRRTALGLIQLLLGKEVAASLPALVSLAAGQLPITVTEEALHQVLDFVGKRFRGHILELGYRYDLVDAVLAERGHNLWLAYRTVRESVPWLQRADWGELLDTYARCVRITRDQQVVYGIDETLLTEPAALALLTAYRAGEQRLSAAGGSESRSVEDLFQVLLELKPFIRRFFDDILVMAEDVAVRQSRLGLLQALSALPRGMVDLTFMEGF